MESSRITVELGGRRWTLVVLALGVALAAWRIPSKGDPHFFVGSLATAPSVATTSLRTIDLPTPTPSAHASSIAVQSDNTLQIAWFGGAREGAADVGIWIAEIPSGANAAAWHWQALTPNSLASLTGRVIRTIGNPVLWLGPDRQLHLFVVSVSYGGWSGSSINSLILDRSARTVTSVRRLILSPLFNLSTLVRAQPVPMSDGSIGLPAYHEFIHKAPLWVHLSVHGDVIRSAPMSEGRRGWLQPAVAALSPTAAIALLRCADPALARIGRADSDDVGHSWASEDPLSISNPDSGIALLRLRDGSLLLAANPVPSGRSLLQLFRSVDDGASWTASRVVETSATKSDEFSYPCLAEGGDGTIHLSYTRLRKGIRLLSFGPDWPAAKAAP